ncbi:MAG: DegQ family serine endoprotease [Hahellaceae bacterium]|jgi:serine protease Do|nr:DegQ family serine endoprotease [Hahellaceae bacterium]MCP5212377.1 DegQ family serine endoprotease [Hahellaceae bacterium]
MNLPYRLKSRSVVVQYIVLFFSIFTATTLASAASLPDFTELVEDASPSVVNISTSTQVAKRDRGPMSEEELQQIPEFFRHFFGAPFGRGGTPEPRSSMGSGFIVSKDGYILTNNHVINGADEIIVRLSDRRELIAQLVGADERSDLALLKVDAKDLPVVKLGKSKELKVGEWVLAIGSPFGFDYTVTAGIISALGRSLPNENYVPFIQTDAAINPGNSGGPLFNLDGEVIGINSQIYTRSGGFMGVSFAIPVDVAMEVVEQIKQKGFVSRGWLGVLIQEVNRDLAESFGLSKPHGALVAQVVPDSPAQSAGLKPGDIIVEYEGQEVSLSSDLPHLVGRTKVGTEAKMVVVRSGDRKVIKVTIGELPGGEASVVPAATPKDNSNRLNLVVQPVEPKRAKELDIKGGVLVQQVGAGAGMAAGIKVGDIISSINNKPVESVQQFNEMVSNLPADKAIPMLIVRNGNPAFIVLKIKGED